MPACETKWQWNSMHVCREKRCFRSPSYTCPWPEMGLDILPHAHDRMKCVYFLYCHVVWSSGWSQFSVPMDSHRVQCLVDSTGLVLQISWVAPLHAKCLTQGRRDLPRRCPGRTLSHDFAGCSFSRSNQWRAQNYSGIPLYQLAFKII